MTALIAVLIALALVLLATHRVKGLREMLVASEEAHNDTAAKLVNAEAENTVLRSENAVLQRRRRVLIDALGETQEALAIERCHRLDIALPELAEPASYEWAIIGDLEAPIYEAVAGERRASAVSA